jgi:hypothetical protein
MSDCHPDQELNCKIHHQLSGGLVCKQAKHQSGLDQMLRQSLCCRTLVDLQHFAELQCSLRR